MSALQRIIEIKKTQAAVAAVVGARQQVVGHWLRDGVPAKHVLALCGDVAFQVTPHELRPDIYPHPEDGLPVERRAKAAA